MKKLKIILTLLILTSAQSAFSYFISVERFIELCSPNYSNDICVYFISGVADQYLYDKSLEYSGDTIDCFMENQPDWATNRTLALSIKKYMTSEDFLGKKKVLGKNISNYDATFFVNMYFDEKYKIPEKCTKLKPKLSKEFLEKIGIKE